MLFTDTLGDVNGVARFIRNIAQRADELDLPFLALTSTRLHVPARRTILNVGPWFSMAMPAYPQLQLALPRVGEVLAAARAFSPQVIHVSTPGPVGLAGVLAAKWLGVPIVGVYHTDFPAYLERIFHDEHLGALTAEVMGLIYRRFSRILTRSDEYRQRVRLLGVPDGRIATLAAGIRTQDFHPRSADRERMATLCGGRPSTVRVLYAGRVSIEKNLELLTRVWKAVDARLAAAGVDAQLVIVGDGPYRRRMEHSLHGTRHAFLGFRHGEELAMCYTSSDVFAFPSVTDTLGQVVMESQASGLPVLVTTEGGPRQVVQDGITGFVLAPGRAGDWERVLERLIADAALRARMGAAAHESMQKYSIESSFEQFWGVHAEVAGLGRV
jgi:glycosyltransferase involved in cell wall biosynthesis